MNAELLKAAGILYITNGKILLIQRDLEGDEPGTWGLPAGKVDEGETVLEAAIRESAEEVGHAPEKELKQLAVTSKDGVEFTTFICLEDSFTPVINHESLDWKWVDFGKLSTLPSPIHSGLIALLTTPEVQAIWKDQLNELGLARAMRDGALPSPQKHGTLWLWKMRITGTGTAFRTADDEYVYRPPENYLTSDFVERCNGLPVIWVHTEADMLADQEFHERIIGSVMLPFIEGSDVMGVCRVYDSKAAESMIKGALSTSPSVIFKKEEIGDRVTMSNGEVLLIEGKPGLLDHLAVCEIGVWDKGGEPRGVVTETLGVNLMTSDAKKDSAETAVEEVKKDADMPAWFKTFKDSMEDRFSKLEASGSKDSEEEKEAKKDSEAAESKKDADEPMDAKKDEDNMPGATTMTAADSKKDANGDLTANQLARLVELERMLKPLTDNDYNALADAQVKADSVLQAFGQTASRPMAGEAPLAYRRRIANGLKAHSKTWAAVDLSKLDEATFNIAEGQVFKDAQVSATAPAEVTPGVLRAVTKRYGGRDITEYVGDVSAWTRQFKAVTKSGTINKQH